jgi:hypothetical protein
MAHGEKERSRLPGGNARRQRQNGRIDLAMALVVGALYGLLIYGVNLYGLTELFPWFVVARDCVTLATHVVFGIALAGGYRLRSNRD